MTPEQSVLVAVHICAIGALVTLVLSRYKQLAGWLAFLSAASAAVLVISAAVHVLQYGPSAHPAQFWSLPKFGFALRIYVDGLSSIFLGLIAVISVPAFFYSIGYMRHITEYGVGRYYPYFLLFLAAMYGLVSTTDMMWFFFIFWQMMTLTGYALIRFEYRNPANIHAANKYLIMMQIACAVTMIGAELLASAGAPPVVDSSLKYDFDTVAANLPALLLAKPGVVAVAFALFLVGFGIKLGMWPFGQVWLPDAHPAAPSPVSAMLSGVMIKTGVYGLMRYFLWLVPVDSRTAFGVENWGLVIAVLGTITLFTGTAQALRQEQSKRLLAFSSIGQAGYIMLGLGVCLTLLGSTDKAVLTLASAGLCGALFHTINHGVFKSLLFLNAGSVLQATGTQDMNRLGGLIRYMPVTALTALVASFSIAGVPLFSGFASKWTIYVAAVQGGPSARFLPVCVLVAIFTSAITLALLIKFFGVIFLSRTSALVKEKAAAGGLEVCRSMRASQLLLALLCLLFGLMPVWVIAVIQKAILASQQGLGILLAQQTPISSGTWSGLSSANDQSVYAPLVLAVVLCLMFLIVRGLTKLGGSTRRTAVPWLCGYALEAEIHRYRSSGLYGELKRWFHWVGGAPKPQPESVADKPRS